MRELFYDNEKVIHGSNEQLHHDEGQHRTGRVVNQGGGRHTFRKHTRTCCTYLWVALGTKITGCNSNRYVVQTFVVFHTCLTYLRVYVMPK